MSIKKEEIARQKAEKKKKNSVQSATRSNNKKQSSKKQSKKRKENEEVKKTDQAKGKAKTTDVALPITCQEPSNEECRCIYCSESYCEPPAETGIECKKCHK